MDNPILQQINCSDSYLLMDCYDSTSNEWEKSTIAQKIEALEILISRDKALASNLIVKLLSYCSREAYKGLEHKDVISSLSRIINYTLEKNRFN